MTDIDADNLEQAKMLALRASESAAEGQDAFNDVVSMLQDIRQDTSAIAELVQDIDKVMLQARMLSLNASVEAARAGEAGKGFAIVASELRHLSESIKTTVGAIHKASMQTEERVSSISELADSASEKIELVNMSAELMADFFETDNQVSNKKTA